MGSRVAAGELTRSARELLSELPTLLSLQGERHLRIAVRFTDGRLVGRLRVSDFRIPASALGTHVPPYRANDVLALLERVARLQKIDRGDTELIAEYERNQLRWVDLVWELELA